MSRQRSHSGPDEAMNKGVLAHIRPDRPHERISIPECLSAAPSTDISSAVYDSLTVSLPLYAADRFSPSAIIPGVATESAQRSPPSALTALPVSDLDQLRRLPSALSEMAELDRG